MSADPATATFLMMAASMAAGKVSSMNQSKVDNALIKAETSRAKLIGSETALNATQTFRGALSSQLALSSLRGGAGGSMVRQFGASSMANFLQDQGALESRNKFLDVAEQLKTAGAKSSLFSKDVSNMSSLLMKGADSINGNNTNNPAPVETVTWGK